MPRIKKVYATDIVAVAYTGSEIPVFEKSEAFWIYAVDETKIMRMQILSVYSDNAEEVVIPFSYHFLARFLISPIFLT